MKKFVKVFFACMVMILSGCGGGGGGGSGNTNTPVPISRTDGLYFTYYGSEPGQVEATAAHTNLAMIMHWDGIDVEIAEMQQAKARGLKVMLEVPEAYISEASVRTKFNLLNSLDLLSNIAAFYPIDEPDLVKLTNAQVVEANRIIRKVALEFGVNIPLAVIYTAGFDWPGLSTYNWVGFDHYDVDIFNDGKSNSEYNRLKSLLRPDQRIILVPGGADPWRQDPTPFLAKAQSDPQVIVITAFLYRNYNNPGPTNGIKSNGQKSAYCNIGKIVTNRPTISC